MEKKLSDRIWETRKSRINAETRLRKNATISEFLLIEYSSVLVAISVINLIKPEENNNVFLVIGSIAVLVASIYLPAKKYIQRSYEMRNCYIMLGEMHGRAKRAEDPEYTSKVEQIESEYTNILANIENHAECDYRKLQFNMKKEENSTVRSMTGFDTFMYCLDIVSSTLIYILFLPPPIFLYLAWTSLFGNVSF